MIRQYIYEKNRLNKWRKLNTHNYTIPVNDFDMKRVKVGKGTYGDLMVLMHDKETTLTIGNYCSIAPNVTFVVSSDHDLHHFSTYPFKVKLMGEAFEAISKGNIVVDDDVWIGCNTTILSGVHIGQGAVIGAGAVVTKDVPPYAIVGGVPSKIMKFRFSNEIIEELLKVDYSKLTKEMIVENIDKLYAELNNKNQLDWMPKKG